MLANILISLGILVLTYLVTSVGGYFLYKFIWSKLTSSLYFFGILSILIILVVINFFIIRSCWISHTNFWICVARIAPSLCGSLLACLQTFPILVIIIVFRIIIKIYESIR
jgi:hypothetical protein